MAEAPVPSANGRDMPTEEADAAWGWRSTHEPRWPATLAVLVAIVLYVILPESLSVRIAPTWLIALLAGVLALTLFAVSPTRRDAESRGLRIAAIVLIALINAVNLVSLGELIHKLLYGYTGAGRSLVIAAVPIWLTNVIVFGLWYWELDRGGPSSRLSSVRGQPDFLFPQMSTPLAARKGWTPNFFDYMYTSLTNATAFSPTDTMPLTAWAKALMGMQSLTSLVLLAVVVSRAVNILR
jgi:uncharacterized membrane protein